MSDSAPLAPGLKGTAETSVTALNTAVALGSGEVEVFATPALVALMEAAAVQCVRGHLAPGETSVGTRLEISHMAATPRDMAVRAEAVLDAVEGRRLIFLVAAYDEREKIGEGRHERVVVQRDRFVAKIQAKGQEKGTANG